MEVFRTSTMSAPKPSALASATLIGVVENFDNSEAMNEHWQG